MASKKKSLSFLFVWKKNSNDNRCKLLIFTQNNRKVSKQAQRVYLDASNYKHQKVYIY